MTLVCFAVKEEAAFYELIARSLPEIQILLTGMGYENAERMIRSALAAPKPDLVITCGFAGGLRQDLKTGTVVFGSDGDATLGAALRACGATPVRFHCAPKVAVTTREKLALRQSTGAD